MNDFVNKYKNKMKGVKGKQSSGDNKKGITKALHQTLKMAMEGQIAGIIHNGKKYVMVSEEILNSLIQNGGKVIVTEEQKEFTLQHQILIQLMGSMNMELEEDMHLFTDIDQFTFEFSNVANRTIKERTDAKNAFLELVKGSNRLTELYNQLEPKLREQMFPKSCKLKEPENQGKMT